MTVARSTIANFRGGRLIRRFVTDLGVEVRQLRRLQVVAGVVGLLLTLAAFPLGNSIGIVLLPLGLVLIGGSLFLAWSRMDALRGLALIFLILVGIIVLLAVGVLVGTLAGDGGDASPGEVTPSGR